jgi:hypothetical protein
MSAKNMAKKAATKKAPAVSVVEQTTIDITANAVVYASMGLGLLKQVGSGFFKGLKTGYEQSKSGK